MEKINFSLLELSGDALSVGVENESWNMEDITDAKEEYARFLFEIDAAWPPEKLKELLISLLREHYAFLIKKRTELEKENADARRKGVPFADRRMYSTKIASLEGVINETRMNGQKLGRLAPTAFLASSLISPSEASEIDRLGFEEWLKLFHTWVIASLVKDGSINSNKHGTA